MVGKMKPPPVKKSHCPDGGGGGGVMSAMAKLPASTKVAIPSRLITARSVVG
jgi:hypothetical protein